MWGVIRAGLAMLTILSGLVTLLSIQKIGSVSFFTFLFSFVRFYLDLCLSLYLSSILYVNVCMFDISSSACTLFAHVLCLCVCTCHTVD